jgi:hypothetical protein
MVSPTSPEAERAFLKMLGEYIRLGGPPMLTPLFFFTPEAKRSYELEQRIKARIADLKRAVGIT